MKKYFVIIGLLLIAWVLFQHPKANWQGQLAPLDPIQSSLQIPSIIYKGVIIKPRAKYHIKAVILSKHYYWGLWREDTLSKYDLALGWGCMSDARMINQLVISQEGRWYNYRWHKKPPVDPSQIVCHSSNHHIIAANQDVLDALGFFKLYDVVELDGYLVDIKNIKEDWFWHTSVSRFDTGDGACKIFWVTSAYLD